MPTKTFTRSKNKFKTARAAWADIARSQNLTGKSVEGRMDTAGNFVFVVRRPKGMKFSRSTTPGRRRAAGAKSARLVKSRAG